MPQIEPRLPQLGQTPKPPPGFCQAASEFDCTVRSVKPHCPPALKSMFACTETQ